QGGGVPPPGRDLESAGRQGEGGPDARARAGERPQLGEREEPPRRAQALNGLRAALGTALGAMARLYLATLRARVILDPALDLGDPRPFVLCFWHGDQMPLFRWKRRRPTVALVSLSPDGQMQARALRWQGLAVERGSTSRAGARGLVAIVRRLRARH